MLGRRAFLAAGSVGFLSHHALAQGQSRLRDLLSAAMVQHRVPGASAAVIRSGEIVDTVAVGADAGTLFQAASISKVVTATVVLCLVDQGRLVLDTPVNDRLRSWKLPGTLPDAGASAVTPRLLLGHRAGTTVPGFPGYAVGARLPTLGQILDGTRPANTPAVRVAWPPGEAFRYSGGGTMVLERLAMDAAARDFDSLARELVLGPAGMTRSGFFQPLPATETNAASGYDGNGKKLPGDFHVYPEQAAAGLWSTPTDLARLAFAIAASWRDGGLLARPTAHQLATPIGDGPTGAGIFVQPRGSRPPYLYHYGVNAGFRSVLVFAADASFGAVLMTNGDGGRMLIPDVLGGLFDAYGQEPFRPAD
jgi:CubicO group peptidase (beta-lactamase class C family)